MDSFPTVFPDLLCLCESLPYGQQQPLDEPSSRCYLFGRQPYRTAWTPPTRWNENATGPHHGDDHSIRYTGESWVLPHLPYWTLVS
jgi:hypothetical protein